MFLDDEVRPSSISQPSSPEQLDEDPVEETERHG
jgi:hypothetical protein